MRGWTTVTPKWETWNPHGSQQGEDWLRKPGEQSGISVTKTWSSREEDLRHAKRRRRRNRATPRTRRGCRLTPGQHRTKSWRELCVCNYHARDTHLGQECQKILVTTIFPYVGEVEESIKRTDILGIGDPRLLYNRGVSALFTRVRGCQRVGVGLQV